MTRTIPARTKTRRVSYAALALLLLGSLVFEAAEHATGYCRSVCSRSARI